MRTMAVLQTARQATAVCRAVSFFAVLVDR
jgi:hypothetical protein